MRLGFFEVFRLMRKTKLIERNRLGWHWLRLKRENGQRLL